MISLIWIIFIAFAIISYMVQASLKNIQKLRLQTE